MLDLERQKWFFGTVVVKRHLFVCYSHSDLLVAKALVRQLESRGFICWAAFRDLTPGQPPLQSFHRALQQSQAALFIQSPAAENSSEIFRQLEWLVVNDRPCFVLFLGSASEVGPFDSLLKRAVRYGLPTRPTVSCWNQLADILLRNQIPAEREAEVPRLASKTLRRIFSGPAFAALLAALLFVAVGLWFVFEKFREQADRKVVPYSKIMEQTRELQRVLNKESTVQITPPSIELAPQLQNSMGMKFALIPSGSFTRRSALNPTENYTITLTKPFYLGVTEVTQKQFKDLMGVNASFHPGDLLPVDAVTWYQAVEFCERLNALSAEIRAGRVYRLPTEAEWEFAARAGSGHRFFFGENPDGLEQFEWFSTNSKGTINAVGVKLPNPWGLYDMLGNVHEWCSDWLAEYPAEGLIDPAGPKNGEAKVQRGGAYYEEYHRSDANWRSFCKPNVPHGGIRVVCEIVEKATTAESPEFKK